MIVGIFGDVQGPFFASFSHLDSGEAALVSGDQLACWLLSGRVSGRFCAG